MFGKWTQLGGPLCSLKGNLLNSFFEYSVGCHGSALLPVREGGVPAMLLMTCMQMINSETFPMIVHSLDNLKKSDCVAGSSLVGGHVLGRYVFGPDKRKDVNGNDVFFSVQHRASCVSKTLPFSMQISCESTFPDKGQPPAAVIAENSCSRTAKIKFAGTVIPLRALFKDIDAEGGFEPHVESCCNTSEFQILERMVQQDGFSHEKHVASQIQLRDLPESSLTPSELFARVTCPSVLSPKKRRRTSASASNSNLSTPPSASPRPRTPLTPFPARTEHREFQPTLMRWDGTSASAFPTTATTAIVPASAAATAAEAETEDEFVDGAATGSVDAAADAAAGAVDAAGAAACAADAAPGDAPHGDEADDEDSDDGAPEPTNLGLPA